MSAPASRCQRSMSVPGAGTRFPGSALNVSARFPVSVPGARFPVLTQVSDPRVPVQVGLLLPHGARHRSRSMPRPLLRHETTPTWQICIAPPLGAAGWRRGRSLAAYVTPRPDVTGGHGDGSGAGEQ